MAQKINIPHSTGYRSYGILSFLFRFAGKTKEILQIFTPVCKYALTKRA
jgi:hypothetical protein